MSESLTLYELVPERGAKSPGMSPYVWRTRLDLAILGMKYNIEAFNFIQISQDLPKVTGIEKTTVPIIKTPEGEFIMDSEAIAEWLEERYAKTAGKCLYGEGEAGRAFVKLIEIWTKNDLVGELRPLTVPSIHSTLDAESQEYFVRTKFGEARKFKALADKNTDQKWVETQTASARKRLQLLEEHLASEKKSLKTDHVFLGGRQATHADSIVFGWYMFTRVNRKVMLDQVWTHELLPNLQEWIKSLVYTGLVKQEDLENLPRSKL